MTNIYEEVCDNLTLQELIEYHHDVKALLRNNAKETRLPSWILRQNELILKSWLDNITKELVIRTKVEN